MTKIKDFGYTVNDHVDRTVATVNRVKALATWKARGYDRCMSKREYLYAIKALEEIMKDAFADENCTAEIQKGYLDHYVSVRDHTLVY